MFESQLPLPELLPALDRAPVVIKATCPTSARAAMSASAGSGQGETQDLERLQLAEQASCRGAAAACLDC